MGSMRGPNFSIVMDRDNLPFLKLETYRKVNEIFAMIAQGTSFNIDAASWELLQAKAKEDQRYMQILERTTTRPVADGSVVVNMD